MARWANKKQSVVINGNILEYGNMYFDPEFYSKLECKDGISSYIAKSINDCPFDVKAMVLKVILQEYCPYRRQQ